MNRKNESLGHGRCTAWTLLWCHNEACVMGHSWHMKVQHAAAKLDTQPETWDGWLVWDHSSWIAPWKWCSSDCKCQNRKGQVHRTSMAVNVTQQIKLTCGKLALLCAFNSSSLGSCMFHTVCKQVHTSQYTQCGQKKALPKLSVVSDLIPVVRCHNTETTWDQLDQDMITVQNASIQQCTPWQKVQTSLPYDTQQGTAYPGWLWCVQYILHACHRDGNHLCADDCTMFI